MPAKGKHRRPKSLRLTRTIAVAGTGGAALALPLIGATGANAATGQSVPEKAVQSVQVAAKKAPAQKASAQKTRTYEVKRGDYLAKIADQQDVRGGWKKLYADNREAVGADPSLIHPGLKLSIGTKAEGAAPKASAPAPSASKSSAKPAAKPAAPQKAAPAAQSADEASTVNGFSAPVSAAAVGTSYKVAGSMWSSGYHTGVDFSAPTGTPLKAVGAGTVVSAGWGGAYGNQVVIRLADGYYAQYAHLSSLSVSSGQTVTAGQQIGLSGATGNVTGPHLHFEIRTAPGYGSDVDPVAYLRSKGVAIG
ncbi:MULTISPECIES: LysM peptidoglycan-binding domain-containing M23 family metallopeptidase [Streptomyces]|uniref:LysM peptidoglycan-binding domain-containing M23 family metallopeptidase n=1 Tax=Streptomyces TaxID=1883 RepID=UPI001F2D3A5F|nr:LysM peptidoglycan-binding domain-containing M23 family metallopeptidase [Streptomyces sp. FB2]MCF2537197.1 LysM peptidoglycan-binding domain-containing M23 family metallopeptidase [Streptomyces sp. FB2]